MSGTPSRLDRGTGNAPEPPPDARPPSWRAAAFALLPAVAVVGVTAALLVPPTSGVAGWMLRENRPVEVLTFVFLALAGVQGLVLARNSLRSGASRRIVLVQLAFAIGMLLVAMEEIAWGQQFFGFETPPDLLGINKQRETTLHNIGPLQGRSDLFRLAFGVAGLLALRFRNSRQLAGLAPAAPLRPWFLVISVHAALDVLNDVVMIQPAFDRAVARSSELVELLIAMTAWFYVRDASPQSTRPCSPPPKAIV